MLFIIHLTLNNQNISDQNVFGEVRYRMYELPTGVQIHIVPGEA